jgi:hypothetical protein
VDSDERTINLILPGTLCGPAEALYRIFKFTNPLTKRDAVFRTPLESVLPMLTKILFEVISKLVGDWISISEYIEPFVASKLTFLHEEQHDSLLFDDDTFSRSRQYSWVITSINEFIPITLKTSEKYSEVKQWAINLREEKEKEEAWAKAEEYSKQLDAIAERFKSQKARAEALRDEVSSTQSENLIDD